ncbi:hypothetical protein B5807_08040 [Epicoccum nigrum]|jgi:hypothetical protein|uniref:Uncharacterized protein n=1 Tax=Epicoccum nigrum TaxID=105696 RepID=A0A1Y2LQ14_EPING|nr:hypothetical protein B5807_08040 [Epicoccum nigrum]
MKYNKVVEKESTNLSGERYGKTNEFIHHSELPPEAVLTMTTPNRRSFVEKLGVYNIGVLIVGSIAIFIAIAFLTLLWSGSETARNGQATPVLWFHIAERPNWATRVVTVGSVVVRLATAAQVGLLAALLAAWTLETTGASAEHLPLLSIIRTVNNGPQSHIWNVFHSLRAGTRWFYSALIIVAILDALALQFTSTLLVTDFGHATVVPSDRNQSIAYGIISSYEDETSTRSGVVQATIGVDLNLAVPPAYPRFAEYSDSNSSNLGTGYVDTGDSLRAFLPISNTSIRGTIRTYKGPATVVDSRVRCARPSLLISNVTFIYQSGTNEPYEIIVVGNITMDATIPGVTVNMTEAAGSFMTTAMARIYANTTDWRLSYSMVSVGDIIGPMSPITGSSSSSWSWLLLNITGNWTSVLTNLDTGMVGPFDWTQTPSGVWTESRPSDHTVDIGIGATVCFANLDSNDYWIHAGSERDLVEPKDISWIRELWRYDTEHVRKMMGATREPLSLNERGILSLKQPANWTETIMNATGEQFITDSILQSLRRLEHAEIKRYYPDYDQTRVYPQTALLTPYSQYNSVNRALAAVFQDIIQSTGNPALAFQAMFTTMSQTAYYQALPLFFLEGAATLATSVSYTVPVRWTGYAIVMALLVVHAILVITAMVLFLSKTDHSLLGNAWQAVAQVSSSDTMDTMRYASNMTDLEVKRLLRTNSFKDNEVVLKTSTDDGRSQAVYRRTTGERC